jgi:hypothetical protein|tara:strand:+ start:1886 stop:2047 length:162 start_codon:yes stop_codon:yes gene_type:complete
MINWIVARLKEMSTWSGAGLVALSLVILLAGPFVQYLAWAGLIWGIISMIKSG